MNRFAIATLAAVMSLSLSALPAIGADETLKEKAVDAKDKVKDKAIEVKDTVKEKAIEAKDKVKEKTVEAKDKVKAKMGRTDEKAEDKAERAKDKMAMKADGDVRQAQMALKEKGQDPGPIDGIMGPRTSAAVRSFQKAENLKDTGQLDADTKTRLMVKASTSTSTPAASPASPPASPEKKQGQ
jgi:peptidoglycan hydrolase-like protein with peptidoglycan-binding domain